jgi:hypothetical protein
MILKVDHLAFSSPNLAEAFKIFYELGYSNKFEEKGLRDLENKRKFMKHFSGYIDMALMTCTGSMSIELLNHGHAAVMDTYIFPVFEGVCFEMEKLDDLFVVNNCSFVKARSNIMKAEFFIPERAGKTVFRCNKVVVEAENIECAINFWRCLGFRPVIFAELFACLEFKTPFIEEVYQLYIRKRKRRANRIFLDSQGFNCIALFSTDVEKERKRLEKLDIETSESNLIRVNGKDLRIIWVRGPSSEIVEIISLA